MHCLNLAWIPTNEEHDWIPIELGWVLWAPIPKTNKARESIVEMTMVHRISIEKKIGIP
jgi:hypothetical protein